MGSEISKALGDLGQDIENILPNWVVHPINALESEAATVASEVFPYTVLPTTLVFGGLTAYYLRS